MNLKEKLGTASINSLIYECERLKKKIKKLKELKEFTAIDYAENMRRQIQTIRALERGRIARLLETKGTIQGAWAAEKIIAMEDTDCFGPIKADISYVLFNSD